MEIILEYQLKISEKRYSVEATRSDRAGSFLASINQAEVSATAQWVSRERLRLQIGEKFWDLFIAETPDGTWIWIDGRARLVQDAKQFQRRSSRRMGDIPDQVTPPTPATVIRILVDLGTQVQRGDPLIVVSAMKMEITLSAPYSGIVKAINTKVAAQVSPGEILVEIEPVAGD